MRQAGILLHISSLPNQYGIGTLGKEAYDFVDFLVKSKQKLWQVLPICPTSFGDSPYQTTGSFGGNPYFIDFDLSKPQGAIVTNLNGSQAQFMEELHEGDMIEVYWKTI